MRLTVIGLIVASVTVIAAPALAATGPVTLGGPTTWCPSYQGNGTSCEASQSPSQYTVGFSASQVTQSAASTVTLSMDLADKISGAINDLGTTAQYISDDEEVWEQVDVPCNAAGQVENWPAFWLDGTVGSWPAHGEIDIAEGLNGGMWFHYHYVNAAGSNAQAGAEFTGNVCGAHYYTVMRTSSTLTFYKDSVEAGTITSAQIGVPLATDPMYALSDYAAGSVGGPTVDNTSMVVSGYGTYAP
jgi:hypothetical protein